MVTGFVILIGAALLYLTEQGQGTAINSFGDALYWTTMMVVGTEGGLEMRTTLGRLITLGLIGYSIVVFSYLVGAIASLWVERDREAREGKVTQAGATRSPEPPSP